MPQKINSANKMQDYNPSDGWHHTGAFYGITDYFSIASPYDIVLSLCSERKKFGEALKKGLKS